MSFDAFKERVSRMISKVGNNLTAEFSEEDGKHIAVCSDGTLIIGNSQVNRVQVKWGSGHVAYATI